MQRLIGDVQVVVRSATALTTHDLEEHVREVSPTADRTRVTLVAIVGDGADFEFSFELRAKLSKADLLSKPVAVLAPQIRPERVASLKWAGAEIRCFGPDAFDDACESLAIAPSLRPEVRVALEALKQQLRDEPRPEFKGPDNRET